MADDAGAVVNWIHIYVYLNGRFIYIQVYIYILYIQVCTGWDLPEEADDADGAEDADGARGLVGGGDGEERQAHDGRVEEGPGAARVRSHPHLRGRRHPREIVGCVYMGFAHVAMRYFRRRVRGRGTIG